MSNFAISMNLELFAILTIATSQTVNVTSTERKSNQTYNEYLLNKTFVRTSAGNSIAEYLSNEDLQKIAEIPVMSECANFVLNRRSQILHYRNGKINPPFLAKAHELAFRTNFTDDNHIMIFARHHWWPQIYMLNSEEPTNGFLFPQNHHPDFHIRSIILGYFGDDCSMQPIPKIDVEKWPLKLVILLIDSDNPEIARNRVLNATQIIRRDHSNALICAVAQATTQNVEENSYGTRIDLSQMFLFYGFDTHASTLVVDEEDTNETLKTKFEDWKRKLFYLDSHQTIAFHFTVVNGTEPENSEKLFSNTFPDIPLSTLRLRNQPLMTAVHDKVGFHEGPVYVIIGIPKYG